MLRSQGIPARLIVGYKCDEWNPIRQCYVVRQLHAHTWVEAYLRPNQIPNEWKHGGDYWPWAKHGGWLRLDPTPGEMNPLQKTNWFTPVQTTMDWLDSVWRNYVTELDAERQRSDVYGPIERAAQSAYQAAKDTEYRYLFFSEWAAGLHLGAIRGVVAWLLILLSAGVFIALSFVLGYFLWRRGRGFWGGFARKHNGIAYSGQIEFYRQLEAIFAQSGLQRNAGQTQSEFAAAAGQYLALAIALATGESQWFALSDRVVEAFYRVRFGRQPLDNAEVQAVEHALGELAAWNRRTSKESTRNTS
jgi:hypothetical protein